MIIPSEIRVDSVKLDGQEVEQMSSFNSLGSIIEENGKVDEEIYKRMGMAGMIYNILRRTFLERWEIPKSG